MGWFFNRRYEDIEQLNCITLGEAEAHRIALDVARTGTNVKWLRQLEQSSSFYDARELASRRLTELSGKSRFALRRLEKEQVRRAEQAKRRQAEAEAARKAAEETEGTPENLAKRGKYAECAACGQAAVGPLLRAFLFENSTGRDRIGEALLSLGAAAYPATRDYVAGLLANYKTFCGGISRLDFSKDNDRKSAAVIEKMSDALEGGVRLVGRFADPGRAGWIDAFYDDVKRNVYYHPEGGFSDMFHANRVRRAAVAAMGQVKERELRDAATAFYVKALSDPARQVRWEAVDILRAQFDPGQVNRNPALKSALEKALGQEDNNVSNRKEKLRWLLAKDK